MLFFHLLCRRHRLFVATIQIKSISTTSYLMLSASIKNIYNNRTREERSRVDRRSWCIIHFSQSSHLYHPNKQSKSWRDKNRRDIIELYIWLTIKILMTMISRLSNSRSFSSNIKYMFSNGWHISLPLLTFSPPKPSTLKERQRGDKIFDLS